MYIRSYTKSLVVVASAILLFSLVLFSFFHRHDTFPDPDAFYHAKMALRMRDTLVVRDFPWLPYTTLAEGFSDQQFLYHVLLIPFVVFGSPLLGVKIASIVFSAVAIVGVFLFFRSLLPSAALLATASLFTSSAFLTRLLLGKAQPLALLFLFLLFYAILRDRPRIAFLAAFAAVWLHGSWPIAIVAAVFFLCSPHVRSARTALLGGVVALALHPTLLPNLRFFWDQTVRMAFAGTMLRGVGAEWYPPTLMDFAVGAPLQSIAMVLLFFVFLHALFFRRLSARSLILFIITNILLLATFRARRFIEFLVPMVTAVTVSLAADYSPQFSFRALRQECLNLFRLLFPRVFMRGVAVIGLCVALLVIMVRVIQRTDAVFRGGYSLTALAGTGAFINESIPVDTVIALSDWSIFPQLFFYTDHRRFLLGLDPRFLLLQDPNRFMAWERLRTETTARPSQIMREELRMEYAVVPASDIEIRIRFTTDPNIETVYDDNGASVFRVL